MMTSEFRGSSLLIPVPRLDSQLPPCPPNTSSSPAARLRPGQRHRRPGARSLDPWTARSSSRRAIRPFGRRGRSSGRAGRHARRHRHALPHRRAEGQRRPQDAARGKAQRPRRFVAPPITHSGTMGSVPSTFATGYKYAGLGYTTAFDAAIPPLAARHAHEEFDDTPCIDKGFYVLMGNNHYVMQCHPAKASPSGCKAFVAWLLAAAKGYAPKLVNPGGVEVWKQQPGGNVQRARRAGRALRRHAAADHPRRRPGRRRAEAAAPGPHPLQQPGHARQLDDHARNDAGPRRAPRPHHAHPVPQLRRRRRRREHVQQQGRASWPTTSTRTRTSRSTSARCCSARPRA